MPLTRIFILRPWWIAYEEPSASMSVRPAASNELLTTKQRLCVFHNTELSAEKALALSEEDMNDTLLTSHAVKAENLAAAGVGPRTLKRMGVPDAASLRKMGFDSLYLTDSKFAAEANAAFGAEAVVDAFLMSASDAVAIAGSDAVGILGISTTDLLDACAGAPVEAASVLQQLPHGLSLEGVSVKTLLDTGLRKAALSELGYSLSVIVKQTGAGGADLGKLGYGL
jgi:hypothetical protein